MQVVGRLRRRPAPFSSWVRRCSLRLLSSTFIYGQLVTASIGTIGPLFFTQGAVGIFLSILIALIRRIFISLLGALFGLGTIIGLLLASHGGLFGYSTTLNAPWAKTSLGIEAASVIALVAGGLLAVVEERAHVRRWRSLKFPGT